MTASIETPSEDFISLYLAYTSKTECPTFFHRWTAITSLSAYLGRQIHFNHGHFTLYPNLYTMLIGSPGTKKSSAIKIGAKLLKQAGYSTFAAKKTRQEKFLLDLAEQSQRKDIAAGGTALDGEGLDILDQNLFGGELDMDEADNYTNKPPAECFIAADEFNNFIGLGNLDFISILGELWDYEGVYDYKLKNSKSVFIPNPTITILGGNTATGFAAAFPTETIGQGFFSRLLLIHGEPTGKKYTFPPPPDTELQDTLIKLLYKIKEKVTGELILEPDAMKLIDRVYHNWEGLDDVRFEHYANRRLTHLLKICLVITASRIGQSITVKDVIYANTILTFTEQLMPKALGEFGKAKHSETTHKVMMIIENATLPVTFQAIWKEVHMDLDNRSQQVEILASLQIAEKIQSVTADKIVGYLPIKKLRKEGVDGAIDWEVLTKEERGMI